MSFSIVPVRFHQIRQDQTLETIADTYDTTAAKIAGDNPGIEQPGEMLVINLERSRDSALS